MHMLFGIVSELTSIPQSSLGLTQQQTTIQVSDWSEN